MRAADIISKHYQRFSRYGVVSIANAVFGQLLFLGLLAGIRVDAVVANLVSATIAGIPTFCAYRWWVWRCRGRADLVREAVPVFMTFVIGVLVASGAVLGVQKGLRGTHLSRGPEIILLDAAVIVAYGIVWLARYGVLHHWVFGRSGQSSSVFAVDPVTAQVASTSESVSDA